MSRSVDLKVTSPIQLRYERDGIEWLLEIEIETDPDPEGGDGETIPVSLTPLYTEAGWEPMDKHHFYIDQPKFLGLNLEIKTRRYRVTRLTPRAECGSRGPRIGSEGAPLCRKAPGHEPPHAPGLDDGWGAIQW